MSCHLYSLYVTLAWEHGLGLWWLFIKPQIDIVAYILTLHEIRLSLTELHLFIYMYMYHISLNA